MVDSDRMNPGPLDRAWAEWEGAVDCGFSERLWSASELRQEVRRAAAHLAGEGVGKGHRVAVMLSNTAAFPVWMMACL
jgi:acyl-coenzyme A synthetase/AMP-(fatty) acid ligase